MPDSKNNTSQPTLASQVASIMSMNIHQLRQTWRDLLGKEAPALHTSILRQRLVWKVQEQASGGLSSLTQKRLKRVTEAIHSGTATPKQRGTHLPNGTKLVREYGDEKHEVLVTPDGFEYRGEFYKSLTAIAKQITVSQWNGPAFFGLREKKKSAKRNSKGEQK